MCGGGEKGLSNDSTTCWKEEVSVQSEWSFEKAGMRTYLWMMDGIFISISPLSLSLTVSEMKQNGHSKHYSRSSNKDFMLHQAVRTQAFFLSLSVPARVQGSGEDPRAECVNEMSECRTPARVKTCTTVTAENGEAENPDLCSLIKLFVDVRHNAFQVIRSDVFALTVVAFACTTPSAAIYSNSTAASVL